jgi:hypothetical protein
MELHPAESTNGDPFVGGFIARWPSGTTKQVAWRFDRPIYPTLDAAKQYAAKLIEALSAEAKFDDMERTNWSSAVAAIQKIISDWNEKVREHQFADALSTMAKRDGKTVQ